MTFRKLSFSILLRPILVGFPSKVSLNRCLQNTTLKSSALRNYTGVSLFSSKNLDQESKCVELAKGQIIAKLNFDSTEHALPFYKLPINTLLHIYKVTKNDNKHGYCKNRLYYIASRLKCPPGLLSKNIAQRNFIYSLSFDWLEKSLNVLFDMGVTSDRIIRDLWVLKYKSDTIQERLQKVKNMGVEKMYPWMVRCSEDILKRYVTLIQETRDILGETNSTQTYLAKRLNISVETVNEMCLRTPSLKTIRVTKVKHFLDFLISEGYTVEEIANKPRIFTKSQKTIKQRIDKLRHLGLNEINLNVLCRTKNKFERFCESLDSDSKK